MPSRGATVPPRDGTSLPPGQRSAATAQVGGAERAAARAACAGHGLSVGPPHAVAADADDAADPEDADDAGGASRRRKPDRAR
ncbi:hypothetical protein [Streptomyces albiflavescens]|uniref:hypothetical protein n=1 Tax=Streptomyces albiflavescens TaxID=1623582 RepID=UPI001664129C|nr:hypothetical protein [Streptomyces albiflavescens]